MKLLLNDKEIASFLIETVGINRDPLKKVPFGVGHIESVVDYVCRERNKKSFNIDKMRVKIKSKIKRAVEKDLNYYVKQINNLIKEQKDTKFDYIHKHVNYFIDKIGEEKIFKIYINNNQKNFVKSTGLSIDTSARLMRRIHYKNVEENCLLRNTVGNENILVDKIDNGYPFWFIDSGYTNFIEPNKKWHRLVPNHLHYGKFFDAPVDRLGVFSKFPMPWRTSGDKILVIEPGKFAANIFHVDINDWKLQVEKEIRKYSDKRIIFREKVSKKHRQPLYQHLCDEDYYCVISINSNAATEAIWAGIPAITLSRHVTNPVTKNSIEDINNLLRPNLASWLCMLSYCQFTYDELINGHAVKMIRKYYV